MAKKKTDEQESNTLTTEKYIESLKKKFGSNEENSLSKIDRWCSTRSLVVDSILAGGREQPCSLIPFGRQVELSGAPGSGKTTLCAQIAVDVQQMGGIVYILDVENRLAEDYWESLGVDLNKAIIETASSTEEMFRKQIHFIKTLEEDHNENIPVLMILDSIGSVTADAILENEDPMGKSSMGVDARVISHGMKIINSMVSKNNIAYVYTNQLYSVIGGYGGQMETGGGQKLKYLATVRLQLKKTMPVKLTDDLFDSEKIVGSRIRIKALKNSMSPNLLEREAVLIGGVGFSNDYTVLEVGKTSGLIKTAGSWSTWITSEGEEIKFQGWDGFLNKVVKHPLYTNLVEQVSRAIK